MERVFTEDDYIRCDIVTGRLYRCLTSLFQDFLEIQFSSTLGNQWMRDILNLAETLPDNMNQEKSTLRALLNKRDEKGLVLMDKTCIDVTIANTLMLYTCYYLVSVPQYQRFSNEEMIDIIHSHESKPASAYKGSKATDLRNMLMECIRHDIKNVLKCQEKMRGQKKNEKIKSDDFYKKIQRLVENKNRLNSHMSTVSDPIASEREITDTIMNLEEFLDYLAAAWEYQSKNELLEKYRKELNIIRYLRSTPKFADVTSVLNSVINSLPTEKHESKTVVPDNKPNKENHLYALRRGFELLSNAKNHCTAYTELLVESDSTDNPCATIMLAFMYYCGWTTGHTADEILMTISFISDPVNWTTLAKELVATSKKEEKSNDDAWKTHRIQAAAYYIGHAMMNNDSKTFEIAGYLGVILENYEIAKACFQYASKLDSSNQTVRNYYNGICSFSDESAFQEWAKRQNHNRRLGK